MELRVRKTIEAGIEFVWSMGNGPSLKDVREECRKEFGNVPDEELKFDYELGPHGVPIFLKVHRK